MSGKSIVSDLSVGTSFELTKTLAHAVSKAGGTKAHLLYLLNDKVIAAEIADMLVIGAFGPKTYPMPDHYGFSPMEVREKYAVTPAYEHQVTIPVWGSVKGANAAKLMRVRLGRHLARSKKPVITLREEMERHGFRPATPYDLLVWGSEYSPRPGECVYAIGSADDEEQPPLDFPYIEGKTRNLKNVLGIGSPVVSIALRNVSFLSVI